MRSANQRLDTTNQTGIHACNPSACPDGGNYYVSAIDAGRTYLMAGPYASHAAALADVNSALAVADQRDGRAWFMAWGTVRMSADYSTPGILNKHNLI